MSRAVLLSQLSAGVAQLIVSAALKVMMLVFEKVVSGLMRFVPGESTRLAVFAAGAKPTIGSTSIAPMSSKKAESAGDVFL